MGVPAGNKSLLRFRLLAEFVNPLEPEEGTPLWLMDRSLRNSSPWMGKEAGSCMVVHVEQQSSVTLGKTFMMEHAEFIVTVGFRPEGWISNLGNGGRDRLNGWTREICDQMDDGSMLDGKGHPLPDDAAPVFLRPEAFQYGCADFNAVTFGVFEGKEEQAHA